MLSSRESSKHKYNVISGYLHCSVCVNDTKEAMDWIVNLYQRETSYAALESDCPISRQFRFAFYLITYLLQ